MPFKIPNDMDIVSDCQGTPLFIIFSNKMEQKIVKNREINILNWNHIINKKIHNQINIFIIIKILMKIIWAYKIILQLI